MRKFGGSKLKTCVYLRKSRKDEEQNETLDKHRSILLKFAKENNLSIIKIYEEIVSGETLLHRPEMLQLLKDVENNMYDAVLVIDVDRLGRGNMQEQGLILETFKKSNTKIITLRKTYDLQNDFDEEYSEFEAFMARKELKIINRRLQRGRIKSVQDGNYIGTVAPYGYIKKDLTLVPHPEQSKIVKLIFDMYISGYGAGKIANHLNSIGVKTCTGLRWESSLVLNVIKNNIYIGEVHWKKKEYTKQAKGRTCRTRAKEEQIIAIGRHEPVIDTETWNAAQEILKNKTHAPYNVRISNPLSSIVICGICGHKMQLRPYLDGQQFIICQNKCGNKASKLAFVEGKVLQAIKEWIDNYELQLNRIKQTDNTELYENQIKNLQSEIESLKQQKLKLHDLLEQNIYDIDTFLDRSKNISERIDKSNKDIKSINGKLSLEQKQNSIEIEISKYKDIINIYTDITDINKKNQLLKQIIEKVVYFKSKTQKNDNFEITLHPRIPHK